MTCNPITAAHQAATRRALSPKQDQVLRALCLYTHRHRRQPSYRELSSQVGVAAVYKYLIELEAKGWIRLGGAPRGILIPADVYDSIIDTGEPPALETQIDTGEPVSCGANNTEEE